MERKINQILNFYDDFILPNDHKINNISTSKKNTFFAIFIVAIVFFTLLITNYFYTQYQYKKEETLAKEILENFNISTLYSENAGYHASITASSNDSSLSVLGIIEIPSIGINYPILSIATEENLKIAPCRFYGPMPNNVGNLCIAGHNYNNYKFFSRLKNLNIKDEINIYDLSGKKLVYQVYKKYEIDATDFSCTNQNTNGNKELTLITCNNVKGKRRVIKSVHMQ